MCMYIYIYIHSSVGCYFPALHATTYLYIYIYISYIIYHTSYIIHHTSCIIYHTLYRYKYIYIYIYTFVSILLPSIIFVISTFYGDPLMQPGAGLAPMLPMAWPGTAAVTGQ